MPSRRIKALFVCSRNRWRSPTAEQVWRDSDRVDVRARGISPKAERVITEDDVRWADVIFVMERRHRTHVLDRFRDVVDRHRVHVLEIPDEYKFMDPELIDELRSKAGWILDRMSDESG